MRVLPDCLCFCMPFRVFVCCGHSWAILGRSWALLRRSWASPGHVLDALGALLGLSWTLLGLSWSSLGAFLGGLGRLWEASCKKGRCAPLFEAQLGAKMKPNWNPNPPKIGFKKRCNFTDGFLLRFNMFAIVLGAPNRSFLTILFE